MRSARASVGNWCCAAVLVLLATCHISNALNPFLTATTGSESIIGLINDESPERTGRTPANVVLDKIVAFPIAGQKDTVVLRNIGGNSADLNGWVLIDGDGTEFVLEASKECPQFGTLLPAGKLEITMKSDENPCGFSFNLGFRDSIKLMDAQGDVVHSMEWESFNEATAIQRTGSGSYIRVPEDKSVLDLLQELGNYKFLLEALELTKLNELLKAPSDPNYDGPTLPAPPPPPPFIPQFPSHFGFAQDRSMIEMPPPPPPPPAPVAGIPSAGPYTILAPTDDAFKTLQIQLAGPGAKPLTMEELVELPEMESILMYHIIGGEYTSEFLLNNTEIFTSLGAEVVSFADPILTEGAIMFHDSCVDKPTADVYDCEMQKMFGKCYEPFMVSPLAAQWRGGLCERTCERCTCEFGQCASSQMLDLKATNGVVHTIDRVLFPPPIFVKEIPPPEAESIVESVEDGLKAKPKLTIGFKPSIQTSDEQSAITG